MRLKHLFIIGLLIITTRIGYGATFYVKNWASADTGDGTSWDEAKLYIKSGVALMSSGDILIISSGTYTGIDNMMCSAANAEWTGIPSGTEGHYTVIKASTPFETIIDGEDTWNPIYIGAEESWLYFEGFHLKNSSLAGLHFYHVFNSKVIKCCVEESYAWHFRFTRCTDILVEECFTWGRCSYAFVFRGEYTDYTRSTRNVVRRCVVRRDAYYTHPTGNQDGCFVTYWGDDTYFQNCISLDGVYNYQGTEPEITPESSAVFYTANGSSDYSAQGCLAINDYGMIALFESSASPITFTNNACVMNNTTGANGVYFNGDGVTINNNILMYANSGYGIREGGTGVLLEANSNIIANCTYGFSYVESANHIYNCLYNNTNHYYYSTQQTGETTNVNPLTNGLMYPHRIETGSYLATAGESGGICGPTIVKRLGTAGAKYGEDGWNTLTGDDLFPFPNQDTIRTKMRAYTEHEVDGTRGFCADGENLTDYVLSFLGNVWDSEEEPEPYVPPETKGITGAAMTGVTIQ